MLFFFLFSYQSFQELPKPLNHRQKEGAHCSAAVRTDMQPEDKEKERQSQRTANVEVQKSLPQRLVFRCSLYSSTVLFVLVLHRSDTFLSECNSFYVE